MMTPKLPNNSRSITPIPNVRDFTIEDIDRIYAGAFCDRVTRNQIMDDLAELRDMDNYERSTNLLRESLKARLEFYLSQVNQKIYG